MNHLIYFHNVKLICSNANDDKITLALYTGEKVRFKDLRNR